MMSSFTYIHMSTHLHTCKHTPDAYLLTGSKDHTVKFFSVNASDMSEVGNLVGHTSSVESVHSIDRVALSGYYLFVAIPIYAFSFVLKQIVFFPLLSPSLPYSLLLSILSFITVPLLNSLYI